jgi:hypothetical protein
MRLKPGSTILDMDFDDYYFDHRLLVEHTTPVLWKEMVKLCHFDSISTLKKALLWRPGNMPLRDILNVVCTESKIILPYEDRFSPHQLEAILPFLAKLGYKRVNCVPQWPNQDPVVVTDSDLNKIIDLYDRRYSLQTEDGKLLFANQFDYVETYICGPKNITRGLSSKFEGFVCNRNTMSRWPY